MCFGEWKCFVLKFFVSQIFLFVLVFGFIDIGPILYSLSGLIFSLSICKKFSMCFEGERNLSFFQVEKYCSLKVSAQFFLALLLHGKFSSDANSAFFCTSMFFPIYLRSSIYTLRFSCLYNYIISIIQISFRNVYTTLTSLHE